MKVTQAETKLLEFLTNEENLPSTVEILRLANQIRERILARFWRDMKCQLDKTRPSGLPASMVLRFWPDDRLTDPSAVELYYWDPDLENEGHYLDYWIGSEQRKGYFAIQYGISWPNVDSTPSKSTKLYKLEPVAALRKKLVSMDFEEGGSCVGWRPLHDRKYYESVDDFHAFIAKDPEEVLRDMADRFWSLVQETLSDVEKTNRTITGKG